MPFQTALFVAALGALAAASCEAAVEIAALPEYRRPDPFGGIVEPDRGSGAELRPAITLRGARGGYVSCHLIVKRRKQALLPAIVGPLLWLDQSVGCLIGDAVLRAKFPPNSAE